MMSNLGRYQDITRWSKKLGGSTNFLLVVAASGYAVLRPTEAVIKKGIHKAKKHFPEKGKKSNTRVFTVKTSGTSNEGIVLKEVDMFKVLERDGDSCLIEIIGNKNNPYFFQVNY